MSTLKEYRSSLEELAATTPKKKAALIRSLLPTIEAALRSGQSMKDVWHTLEKQGLRMGYHVFRMTLWRARKTKAPTAPGGWGKETKPSDWHRPPDTDAPTHEARDPLANLKRLEQNRPGFHWRATPRTSAPATRTTEESNAKVKH
jgi:hypothetical protein